MIPSPLLLLLPLTAAAAVSKRAEPAPLIIPRDESAIFHDQYTIILKDDSDPQALANVMELVPGNVTQVYENLFKGFTAELDQDSLKALRDHPAVDFVEMDQKMTAPDEPQGQVESVEPNRNATAPVIGPQDQGKPHPGQLFSRQSPFSQYINNPDGGQGVCAYVVDTGVDAGHPVCPPGAETSPMRTKLQDTKAANLRQEFGGRAMMVASMVDSHGMDLAGHGTHVAGILGSNRYGVARSVAIYGIKVLSDPPFESSISNMIAGLNYVAEDAPRRSCPRGIVVNLSGGASGFIPALNLAARKLVERGYFVAVAAGNDGHDVMLNSPASESSVCTVGGYGYPDSNFGPGVDIQAPGVNIYSTLPGGEFGYKTGTSMASPFIAGLAASMASAHGQTASGELCSEIVQRATRQ